MSIDDALVSVSMVKWIELGGAKMGALAYASSGSAVLGIRGAGKTVTATYLAEQLFDHKIPFIAFDPIGQWKFLRVPGKGHGYPVVVAGGMDGDLPLVPETAPKIVEAAMRSGVSLVIDLFSMELSKAQWRRIVKDCVRLLLHQNSQYGLRHIFIEEAAEFIPQRVIDGDVYAEIEKLARMGGNSRLGYTLINQRAEEVNKAVLELCDNLILHRQKGKNSLNSLQKWLDLGNVKDHLKIIESLSTLPTGQAWAWLAGADEAHLVSVPMKNSFHPDRTAVSGSTKLKSKAVDVGAFVSSMKEALPRIEEDAKANDPKALRTEIAVLRLKIVKMEVAPKIDPGAMKVARTEAYNEGLRDGNCEGIRYAAKKFEDRMFEVRRFADEIFETKTGLRFGGIDIYADPPPEKKAPAVTVPALRKSNGALPPGEDAVLRACIQHVDSGGCDRTQLSVLTGYKRSSRDAYISRLIARGYVVIAGDSIAATAEGIGALPDAEPLPKGSALQGYWISRLPVSEGQILADLISKYPASASRESVAAEFKRSSRDAYISRLSSKKLVEIVRRGEIRASPHLFDA